MVDIREAAAVLIVVVAMIPVNIWLQWGFYKEEFQTGKSTTSWWKLAVVILSLFLFWALVELHIAGII